MGKLDGRVAIVTGSGRGIGREIVRKLAADGARIVVNDIDEAPASETVALLRDMGSEAIACVGDVAAPDFGERIVRQTLGHFGDLHIIVNNAGYIWNTTIQKTTDEQWYAMLDVHATGPFRLLRAAAEHIRSAAKSEAAQGRPVMRKVVNVTSVSGVYGAATQLSYAAAKTALIGLTRTLCKEWGRYNVTVNAVGFGYIETRLTQAWGERKPTIDVGGRALNVGLAPELIEEMRRLIPLGRGGTAAEAAGAVYLLCLPESDFISGQILIASGGLTI
ncbi:MAG: SDR family oxidoreductase [Candidatus Lambdaproteobacteria bacterium]|nr:SDR family oxidoreductase [Candidatus Lambdaproteobacteria bacterium]